MRSALVIDLYAVPGVHERVNIALLAWLRSHFTSITFIGDHSFGVTSEEWYRIKFGTGGPVIRALRRELLAPVRVLLFIVRNARKYDRIILIGFSRPHCFLFVPALWMLSRVAGFSLLFHSQLEILRASKNQNYFARIANSVSRRFLHAILRDNRVPKLVLSPHIRTNLEKVEKHAANVLTINHPIIEYESGQTSRCVSDSPKRYAFVYFGVLRDDIKGINKLAELAAKKPHQEFLVAGVDRRRAAGNPFIGLNNIDFMPLATQISAEAVKDIIESGENLVFPFAENGYFLTVSGGVIDALVNRRSFYFAANRNIEKMLRAMGLDPQPFQRNWNHIDYHKETYDSVLKSCLLCNDVSAEALKSWIGV